MLIGIQVSIRAFFPMWVFLYVVQFILMPVIAKDYWYVDTYQGFYNKFLLT